MSHGQAAWLALAIGIISYDIACPPGQTLSEEVDRALEHHPLATWAVGGIVAAHLLNLLPQRVDPIHQLFARLGRKAATIQT